MARPKKNAQSTSNEAPVESGAGNMSPEDFAAIRGTPASEMLAGASMLTSGAPGSEIVTLGAEIESQMEGNWPAAPDIRYLRAALEHIGARQATLEQDMRDLQTAMEKWAASMNQRLTEQPRHTVSAPAPVRAASPKEEAAYFAENFKLQQANDTPYDGIQAWRDAGSPGL